MKKIISAKLRLPLVAFAALLVSFSANAQLYWDTNGDTAGAGNSADGDWDTTTANWSTDSTGESAATTYVAGSDVIFSAGSDAATATVTAVGTPTANSLTFQEGTVTIVNNVAAVDPVTKILNITVSDGANASINGGVFNSDFDIQGNGTFFANAISGGSIMTKTGTGTATFNRLDASLSVDAGKVIYTGTVGAKLKNTTVNNGGTLRLTGNAFDGTKCNLIVNEGGRVEMASGLTQTVSYFQGTGTVAGEGATLKVGGDNKPTTFDGILTGDLDLWAIGTATFTDNAAMEFVIGNNGVNNSILGTGNIVLGGSFNFKLDDADLTLGNEWAIIDVASLTETFGDTFGVTDFAEESAGVWTNGVSLVFTESTGVLNVIPEPSVLAMFACGFGIIGFWRRSLLRKA